MTRDSTPCTLTEGVVLGVTGIDARGEALNTRRGRGRGRRRLRRRRRRRARSALTRCGERDPAQCEARQSAQLTLRVFLLRKSIRMNWPSVIVDVKYALPRLISDTRFTNSTSVRSRANMNVLIMIPERRHCATSLIVCAITVVSSPNEVL